MFWNYFLIKIHNNGYMLIFLQWQQVHINMVELALKNHGEYFPLSMFLTDLTFDLKLKAVKIEETL